MEFVVFELGAGKVSRPKKRKKGRQSFSENNAIEELLKDLR
ncbi:MAG: hypothetical protein CM15mP62_27850 [Rhodospirillaceae bacterium]|nr:MAG: hypothetical protein CM15mP62_27850 [Rhodospirillaceae bacterium]